jgi:Uma2 family endonuclease
MMTPARHLTATPPETFYPSSDGEPLAETTLHADVIIALVVLLRQYLGDYFSDRDPLVLANQFVYYVENAPRLRIAPDVAVVFGVAPGPRDNYKIWEEKQVPAVVFEVTSRSTQQQDQQAKKDLYEQLGIQEYWLFDPKGEWIPEQLRGYRLTEQGYQGVTDGQSQVLGLRFQVEGALLGLYRRVTGERLLLPQEMAMTLKTEVAARQIAQRQAELAQAQAQAAQQRADRLADRMRALGLDPDAE